MILRVIVGLLFALSANAYAQDLGKLISPGELSVLHGDLTGITKCTECHELRGGIPDRKCLDCHKDIDARIKRKTGYHSTVTDKKCFKCHSDHKGKAFSMVEWEPKKFDHGMANTGYPLTGRHAKTACVDCHKAKTKKGQQSYLLADNTCASCHADIHKPTLGARCETCHTAFSWKGKDVTFDHDKVYKLDTGHAKVKCEKCHQTKGIFKVPGYEQCITCHKKDDKHKGTLGSACKDCHKATTWKEVRFDHSKTKYQLTGKHQKVKCENCHKKKGVFKVRGYEKCITCHKKDDKHKGTLGSTCVDCHKTDSWKSVKFNHAKTKYPLTGKHRKVKCEKCHRKKNIFKVEKFDTCDASGCHDTRKRGAIHGNQFKGKKCEECHSVKGWRPTLFSHSASSYKGYKLVGKHKKVKCEKCHKPNRVTKSAHYRPIKTESCASKSCHMDPHKGKLDDKKCEVCHKVENDWKKTSFVHNQHSRFALKGKHISTKCADCHTIKKKTVWKPIGNECIDCHNKDDKHKGTFGPRCGDCHSADTWKTDQFFHAVTGFRLTGAHSVLMCGDCHKAVKFDKGSGSDCQQCHTDPHFNQFGSNCSDCHKALSWDPLKFRHNTTGFRLEGLHRAAECKDCHSRRDYRGTPVDCFSCHQKEFFNAGNISAHTPGNTNCENCHRPYDWSGAFGSHAHKSMTFTGSHREIQGDCSKCHVGSGGALKFPGAMVESDCISCHRADYRKEHANGDPPGAPACPTTCTLCHNTIDFDMAKDFIRCD